MKKLNNKGFTLIELLAVIVILAIILVIVVPKVFDVIDSSKTKSLESSAKSLVKAWNTYETSRTINDKEALTSLDGITDGYYACINEHDANILGISSSDYTIDHITDMDDIVTTPCSVVSKMNGEVNVVLVANPTGTVYSDSKTQTFSNSSNTNTNFMYASSDGRNSWNNQYTDILGDAIIAGQITMSGPYETDWNCIDSIDKSYIMAELSNQNNDYNFSGDIGITGVIEPSNSLVTTCSMYKKRLS